MVKEFLLQGLTCANCATKIENAVKKMIGVKNVTLNFSTSKLKLETKKSDSRNIHKEVEQIVHSYESDVLVIEKNDSMLNLNTGINRKKKLFWLIAGGVTFFTGILFEFPFYINGNIAFVLFMISYILMGTRVIIKAVKNVLKGHIFDENFLMSIATIGALIIGEYSGAVAVMLFYQVGEFFQEMAVTKSKKNIADLMDIRPDYANLQVSGGQIKKVSPETVPIGSEIIVKVGEKIPLDGKVIHGKSMLDTSSLTGESVPRQVSISEFVLSGYVNQTGVLIIETTKTFGESTASKIIELVENAAGRKAVVEDFITKFARYYTPIVLALSILIATVPPLFFGGVWTDWIYRSLVLLIISCPCALVISVPLGFFGGIGATSKKGVLVKGGNYLEALANIDIAVFDKTGTLTKGMFKITEIQPQNNFTEMELLEVVAHAESLSNHPIALSIRQGYNKKIDETYLNEYQEIAGHGISVKFKNKVVLVGNEKLMEKNSIDYHVSTAFGTKVYVAVDEIFAGCISISDEIRIDSKDTMSSLKDMGVSKTVMLTGDNLQIAETVGNEVGVDEVYANLLPQEKVEQVEILRKQKQSGKTLAFIGDGINDAPVLAIADVGIAMGGLGSDAAIEAADVVLMTDEPSKLIEAIEVARFTKHIVWQNIIVILTVHIVFMFLGAIGVASIWEAIFADVGLTLLAVLNTWRILKKCS